MPCDWLGIERLDDGEETDEYRELRLELEVVEAFHIRSQRWTRRRHRQKEHSRSVFGHFHQLWAA